MKIRLATQQDRQIIQQIDLHAFPASENQLVSQLALDLLENPSIPETFSLVAETDRRVVGHIAFSPVSLEGEETFRGYILAPLAVMPDAQKSGIGTQLIQHGLQHLSSMKVNVVFVYGDPKYYGRFGFDVDVAAQYIAPYTLQYPFGWQAMVLNAADVAFPASIRCVPALSHAQLW